MFQQLPTAGLPFQFQTWAEYESFCDDSTVTGVVEGQGDIRWDIRRRRTTAPSRTGLRRHSDVGELAALVALMHCLVVDLDDRLAAGRKLPHAAAVARAGEQVAGRTLRTRPRSSSTPATASGWSPTTSRTC